MEDYEKLELMKKCDFSEFNPNCYRQRHHGIGGATITILSQLEGVIKGRVDIDGAEKRLNTVLEAYGYIRTVYDVIERDYLPLMDKNDPDFSTLFKTSELIKYLGTAIGRFSITLYKNLKVNDEVKYWYNTIGNIREQLLEADTPPFRDRISALEEKLNQKSE